MAAYQIPTTAGPPIIQIGTEGGLLPKPVVIPSTPIGYEYNRRSITVLNIFTHGLLMGPAERADVIIDFKNFAGKTLILYNDAPAPVPAFDPRIDYYTNDPDQTLNRWRTYHAAGLRSQHTDHYANHRWPDFEQHRTLLFGQPECSIAGHLCRYSRQDHCSRTFLSGCKWEWATYLFADSGHFHIRLDWQRSWESQAHEWRRWLYLCSHRQRCRSSLHSGSSLRSSHCFGSYSAYQCG